MGSRIVVASPAWRLTGFRSIGELLPLALARVLKNLPSNASKPSSDAASRGGASLRASVAAGVLTADPAPNQR